MMRIRVTKAAGLSFVLGSLLATLVSVAVARRNWRVDDQVAAGEWRVEVQVPPCESYKNIQVIYPSQQGAPITIECDLMQVRTK